MTINKETGDIIFSGGQVLKARMTLEELMNSRIMEFVVPGQEDELNSSVIFLELRIPDVHGHSIDMDLGIYNKKVGKITIILEDYYNFYRENPYNMDEYEKVVMVQRDFLERVLQESGVPYKCDYDWGWIEQDMDYRNAEKLMINIFYFN